MSDICFVSYHPSIQPFSPSKQVNLRLEEIVSSAEPRRSWQLSYTGTILEYMSLEVDSLKEL